MQLESYREQFANIGINVAGMSYDSAEVLSEFHQKEALGYPLLKDQNAKHVNALGVRNESYEEGHRAYGIPHPGILYVDAQGVIRAKFALAGYRKRPPFNELLEYLSRMNAAGGVE